VLVKMTIDSVVTERQSDYYGKLKGVKITVINDACEIKPLIKAYVWDDAWYDLDSNTQHTLATKQQGEDWRYDIGIITGEAKEFTIDMSVMFSELDLDKAVTLKMYDSLTNRLMAESTYRFNLED
jgi:hypothetical protein